MKKVNLSVPEPCHEDWNKMTIAEQGKFCGSCQKTVIDFSVMSDQQLVAFFKKPAGNLCGRFQQDQLDRDIQVPAKRLPWLRNILQLLIPAFLISFKAQGQSTRTLGRVAINRNLTCKDTQIKKPVLLQPNQLTGKIKDKEGAAITNAMVLIKGTSKSVTSDSTGRFTLPYIKDLPFVLEVSSIGYATMEYVIKDTVEKELLLPAMVIRTTGLVMAVAGKVQQNKPTASLWSTFKRDTISQQLNIYPNPVRSNGNVTIESKKLEKGSYTLHITTIDGKSICVKAIEIERKGNLIRADLPVLLPGQYLLSLTQQKSKKLYIQKLQVL